ncbi:hypothetical protein K474DRAFT_1574178, partial [Panus rudis PR-1116 ss-1]
RCFSHVVNIAVQTGLKMLTVVLDEDELDSIDEVAIKIGEPSGPEFCSESNPALTSDASSAYREMLAKDPISDVRQLVWACRASGQRREAFAKSIHEVNAAAKAQAAAAEPPVPEDKVMLLPEWQLLRDVDTRWSSTFLMIDRVLFL